MNFNDAWTFSFQLLEYDLNDISFLYIEDYK